VILLLNRRRFATHVHCPNCGHVESCRFCDLSLTYHKQKDLMLCHYCGYEQEPLQNCPGCGESAIRYQGLGTEKLEVAIQERFPDHVVRRMDSDTMKKPGSHARTLGAFRRGEIHVLMGTQMIAKRLAFPTVTLVPLVNADMALHVLRRKQMIAKCLDFRNVILVVVVNAHMALHVPDFRAAERTFQLISQVAGRAGRGPRGGRVLVQTYSPDHPAVLHAATHDYNAFVAGEMGHRREHNYPPFQRLARLIVRSKEMEAGAEFAERIANVFQTVLRTLGGGQTDVRLLGRPRQPCSR
jgi:primosomal protein N' (replication factor Y)